VRRPWWAALFVLAMVAGTVLALQPAPPEVVGFVHQDKVKHFAAFAMLYGLGRVAGMQPVRLALGLLAYGVAIEAAQGLLTESRQPSFGDVAANAAGIAAGWAVTRRLLPARLAPGAAGLRRR
jgi:uncharacterized protein YfiM (DUF2279 family)